MARNIILAFAASALLWQNVQAVSDKPNIVVIMSDDQDVHLGSLDAQPYIKRELMEQGLTMSNHFSTVAQCCPSRASWLRGQHAHNTNLTHVVPPGGAWDKFVATGENLNNLPHWLKEAGYKTEYIGKIMNGINTATYKNKPDGWDHTDLLVKPYYYDYNNVVMTMNGERPTFYPGFHQTDVIRAKAIARLEELTAGDEPYYIQIAPVAPHSAQDGPPVPCARHMWSFNDAKAPRTPNFNPEDEFQAQKPMWLKDLPKLNDSVTDYIDWQHRLRLQALLGIDELVEDVVEFLKEADQLDNTYVIYTTDNGYHLGNHRQIGGKGFPYIEDTNIPMIVRGPGVRAGAVSNIPSSHVDMAPTFLSIAGLEKEKWPPFFDGRSLLEEWAHPKGTTCSTMKGKEVINVEFWGSISNGGLPDYEVRSSVYAYKTVRIISEESSWLFSRWCGGNDTELYNTKEDPYELSNLALNPTSENEKVIQRLNGLLLVTKACSQDSCRNPWMTLQADAEGDFTNLEEAMDAKYDGFFASLPQVGFQECLAWQTTDNEGPYYPPESISLGSEYRKDADNFVFTDANGLTRTAGGGARYGTQAQRYMKLDAMSARARPVTDAELGREVTCSGPDYECAPFG